MAVKALPTPEVLRQLLRYEPETGKLFWRTRPVSLFRCHGKMSAEHAASTWNKSHAGKEAFTSVDNYGYRRGSVFNISIRAHQVIWRMENGIQPDGSDIDHIDNDRLNNRLENLRLAERSQNCANRRARRDGTSRFKGVCWKQQLGAWIAYAFTGSQREHLGTFAREEDAARAYDAAAAARWGEYARLNFPASD